MTGDKLLSNMQIRLQQKWEITVLQKAFMAARKRRGNLCLHLLEFQPRCQLWQKAVSVPIPMRSRQMWAPVQTSMRRAGKEAFTKAGSGSAPPQGSSCLSMDCHSDKNTDLSPGGQEYPATGIPIGPFLNPAAGLTDCFSQDAFVKH